MTFTSLKAKYTPEMAACMDFDKGIYYLAGVQKALSDFTSVSTGYTSTDVSWFPVSGAFTVMVEYANPDTGLSATLQTLFSLSGATERFELNLRTAASVEGSCSLYFGPNNANYSPANNPRTLGRKRAIVSYAPGQPVLVAQDSQPVTSFANTASLDPITKFGIGVRSFNDSQVTQATIYKVHIWDGYRSVAEIENIADLWDCRARPLLMNGSSLNNETTYTAGGGWVSRMMREIKADGYVPFYSIHVGGTSPTQQAAVYASIPARYHRFDYLWAEIGLDGDAAAYEAAIDSVNTRLTGRMAIVEPQRDLRHIPGNAGRINGDAVRSWLETYTAANDILYITTLDEMQAKDPTDTYVTTHGTWPSSAYVGIVEDPIHWNATGSEWFAEVARLQLRAAQWI